MGSLLDTRFDEFTFDEATFDKTEAPSETLSLSESLPLVCSQTPIVKVILLASLTFTGSLNKTIGRIFSSVLSLVSTETHHRVRDLVESFLLTDSISKATSATKSEVTLLVHDVANSLSKKALTQVIKLVGSRRKNVTKAVSSILTCVTSISTVLQVYCSETLSLVTSKSVRIETTREDVLTCVGTCLSGIQREFLDAITLAYSLAHIPNKILSESTALVETFSRYIEMSHTLSRERFEIVDSFTRGVDAARILSQTLSLVISKISLPILVLSEACALVESTLSGTFSVSKTISSVVKFVESFYLKEDVTIKQSVSDSMRVVPVIDTFNIERSILDSVTLSEIFVRNAEWQRTLIQHAATLTDSLVRSTEVLISTHVITLTGSAIKNPSKLMRTFTMTLVTTQSLVTGKLANDSCTIASSLLRNTQHYINEVATIVASVTPSFSFGRVFSERVRLVGSRIKKNIREFTGVVSVTGTKTDRFSPRRSYSEVVTLTDSVLKDPKHIVMDSLTLVGVRLAVLEIKRSLTDVVVLTGLATRWTPWLLEDSITLADLDVTYAFVFGVDLSDTITLVETFSKVIFRGGTRTVKFVRDTLEAIFTYR
jgi:hypothetical protein